MRQWGKEMQAQNISGHTLGSRGYLGKAPKWKKQDEEWEANNVVNHFNEFEDPLAKNYIRAHYKFNKDSNTFKPNDAVKLLEKTVVINLPAVFASNHADYTF